jgi:hypothetical protein
MRKSNEILTVSAVLAAFFLLIPVGSLADGFFIAPIGSFMYEPSQQAYIDYDSATGIEQLSILPEFSGDAAAFAWVVPVPGLPEVDPADVQLFRDLDDLTRPVRHSRDGDWDCFGNRDDIIYVDPDGGGIDIISSEMVGYYQTLVLSATEAPALIAFLAGLGFLHEDNLEATTEVINDYVDRSWYFVAMQVDSTALAEIDRFNYGGYYGPYTGRLNPVRLTFPSEEIIYPMKISSLSASAEARVNLYVKTDRRMTFPGATTYYANRFSPAETSGLQRYMTLRHELQQGDFLTKLQRGYRPAEMTEDVVLVPSPVNEEFQLVIYSGLPLTGLLVFSVPVGIAFKRRFWIRRRPK